MESISQFWNNFWVFIKGTWNKIFKREQTDASAITWDNVNTVNPLDMAVTKVCNLAMIEATFDVESDSKLAEPLKDLCKNIEAKRFYIAKEMLGNGDIVSFPATNRKGEVINTYVDAKHFLIANMDGETLTEVYGIIDEYCDNKGNVYRLVRHHTLADNGDLFIEIKAVDNEWNRVSFSRWIDKETEIVLKNAGHIGIGRYKSPIISRGKPSVYGVPLNYGCGEIENKIAQDLKDRDSEVKRGKIRLFVDERIARKSEDAKSYTIDEEIFPVRSLAGGSGSYMSEFAPALRIDSLDKKLDGDFSIYEKQMGLSKGVLTDSEPTNSATATEINTSNASTVALLNSIQNAIDEGNIETLKADALLLNISEDLWSYKSDYYNPFENPEAQFNRLISAYSIGACEKNDIIQWLFPKLSREEIEEKIQRIEEKSASDTQAAIERALSGE